MYNTQYLVIIKKRKKIAHKHYNATLYGFDFYAVHKICIKHFYIV